MNGKYLIVLNPIAGGTSKDDLISTIDSWAKSSNFQIEYFETSGKDDFKNLVKVIENNSYKAVIAAGGDGTFLLCAKALMHTSVPLGFIPTGSANGMASELAIPLDVEQALEIIENEKIILSDMLCFNDEHYGIHISDIGLNAKMVSNFEASEGRGFLAYASGLFSELLNMEPFDVYIKTDEDKLVKNCYMVAFANAKRYGTGALLNSKGLLNDGKFEVCILERLDLTGIAGQFFDLINDDSTYLEVIQCRELHLKTKEPQHFHIDGESMPQTQELKVSIVERCVNLIVPITRE